MQQKEIIDAFERLGVIMTSIGRGEPWPGYASGITESEYNSFSGLVTKQFFYNGWFTAENVRKALLSLGELLSESDLENWLSNYSFSSHPKKVAIIMAGNLPLVGFHDFLSVLLSGNHAVCKLSSDDKQLLPALATFLIEFAPELKGRMTFTEARIGQVDAVIATGSDNSSQYFEQYFGKYPHIFRRNRTSVAILDGSETKNEIVQLGHDIFDFFGLGCRNVAHLLIPEGFDINRFFEGIVEHSNVIQHNKYANNYDYNKAVYLLNKEPLLDNNFVLLRETEDLYSPVGMVHYHCYKTYQEVEDYLSLYEKNIQAVVGHGFIPFGNAQKPTLSDYADGVDTMYFLNLL
jgi:hypothetical protein